MGSDPFQDALLDARRLLLDLERHLDLAAQGRDLTQVGRAWARAAQVEEILRALATPEAREVAMAEEGAPVRESRRGAAPPI
jgi:hypothetical protein